MPFARLTLASIQISDFKLKLADELTNLIAKDLGKRHDLTSVLVEGLDDVRWAIGAQAQDVAAHLEVCVTAGTNTESEKREFIANAMKLLQRAFPTLAPATYVVVRELPATDWGYGGKTQADRAATTPGSGTGKRAV